jgi:hypothetical protein
LKHSHPLAPCSAPCSRFCIVAEAVPFVSSLPRACHASANLPRDASQAHSCRRAVALVFGRSASFSRIHRPQQPAPALFRDSEEYLLGVHHSTPVLPFWTSWGKSALTGASTFAHCCGWLHRRHRIPLCFYQPLDKLTLSLCCSRAPSPDFARDPP